MLAMSNAALSARGEDNIEMPKKEILDENNGEVNSAVGLLDLFLANNMLTKWIGYYN